MNESDLYAVLQVAPDASSGDIRRAYRALLRTHHPDLNPDGGTPAPQDPESGAEQRTTAAILHAYMVLGDPARRADYDRNSSRRITPRQHKESAARREAGAAEPREAGAARPSGTGETTRPPGQPSEPGETTRLPTQRRPNRTRPVPAGGPVYLGFDDPLPPDAVRLGERPPPPSSWEFRRWIRDR